MRELHRLPFLLISGLLLVIFTGVTWGQETSPNRDEIIHVLNRITFGPRPGDVEMVQKMGLQNYIERQLHPETIDDSATDREIAKFVLLQMTPEQLADLYAADHNKAAKQEKKEEKAAQLNPITNQPANAPQPQIQTPSPPPNEAGPMRRGADRDQWHSDAAVDQLEQAKLVRAIDSQRQLQEVLVDFWSNHFNIDVKKKECRVTKVVDDRDVIRTHIWGKFRDLLEASAKSPAMLYYLDNATNSVARGGQFANPQNQPAMTEVAKGQTPTTATTVAPPPPKPRKQGGINENYAREVMELHTIGVDGGYTQKDVQEVARCFTGWTVDRQTGEFVFNARRHDNGAKVVLGHQIPAGGGMQDGETVLNILCAMPACAHHISLELCQRFVADNPPPALVNRIAGVFAQTGGDLRKVTEAILTSPEFLSPSSYGNKIKSPFEFTVSAVRATGSTIVAQQPPPFDKIVPNKEGRALLAKNDAAADRMDKRPTQSLNWHIYEMGEPLFACTPPTGYKEVSSTWVSPGALIDRLNFAMALTQQELSDIRFDPRKILSGIDIDQPEAILNQCVAVLLQSKISGPTRQVLQQTALPANGKSQTVNPAKLIALIIGSPEFQRK